MRAFVPKIKTRGLSLVVVACVVVLAAPMAANAACHIVAFEAESQSVQVNESAGQVTLRVELVGGQPTCAGTVDYQTFNGSAVAGQDYTARQGTLTFTAGDDRKESFSVPITNDTADEPSQQFTVRLSNGTGSISADETPATVTIVDNDPAAQATTSSPAPKQTRSASPTPRTSVSPTAPASPSSSPSPTAVATSASPTASETIQAAPKDDTGGTSMGLILGIVAGLLAAAGVGGALWLRRR